MQSDNIDAVVVVVVSAGRAILSVVDTLQATLAYAIREGRSLTSCHL